MYGLVSPMREGLSGIGIPDVAGWDPVYRWPVLAACIALALSLHSGRCRRTWAHCSAVSAAYLVACQYWQGHDGGDLYGVVSAIGAADDLSAQPGGPRGRLGSGRETYPDPATC